MKSRMKKQKKQGFLPQGSRIKLSLRGKQNYYLSALKLLLKNQSNQPSPSTQTINFLNYASVTKELLENVFLICCLKLKLQPEKEEPVNRQMMYERNGNNSYRNVNTAPLQGQSYIEMLSNPLQKYFVIIVYALVII